jgi:hypothetical protein
MKFRINHNRKPLFRRAVNITPNTKQAKYKQRITLLGIARSRVEVNNLKLYQQICESKLQQQNIIYEMYRAIKIHVLARYSDEEILANAGPNNRLNPEFVMRVQREAMNIVNQKLSELGSDIRIAVRM